MTELAVQDSLSLEGYGGSLSSFISYMVKNSSMLPFGGRKIENHI